MAVEATEANHRDVVRILIIDEVRLYREGLANLLRMQPYVDDVRAAACFDQALTIIRELQLSVVLFNMSTPERIGMLRSIVKECPQTRVIAFGLSDRSDILIACAEAGAAGYLSRDGSLDELRMLILGVIRGEAMFTPQIVTMLLRRVSPAVDGLRARDGHARLTRRECEIVKHIDDGLSNKEIANRLNIDVHTVKNHVHNLLEKLQVRRRGEAAAVMRAFAPSGPWWSSDEVRTKDIPK